MRKEEKVANFDANEVVKQFEMLERAVIDACSMIYLNRIELLDKLAHEIELFVPLMVFSETGFKNHLGLKIEPVESRFAPDQQLIHLAILLNCPVISDDGQVLRIAENRELEYFNSLIMLFFLYFRGKINRNTLLTKRAELLEFAYYAPWISSAADQLLNLLTDSSNKK